MTLRAFRPWTLLLAAVLACAPVARAEDPAAPEVSVLVKEMTAEGTVSPSLGSFTMKLSVRSVRQGWQALHLLPADVSLTDFRVRVGDDDFVHLRRGAEGVDLMLGKEGTYGIDLGFVCRVKEDKAGRSMTLPFAPAVRSLVQFTIPETNLKVTTDPASNFGVNEKEGKTEVVVYGGTASTVTVTWQSKDADKRVSSVVFAEQRSLLSISRGVLRVDSVIDYNIVQGSVGELKLEVADGLNLMGVNGDAVRSWNMAAEGGARVLKVSLLKDVVKAYRLELQFERNLEAVPLTVPVPKIAALGVEREKGALAIAARKGLKVEVASSTDVAQVDVQELPAEFRTSADIQLGFKYLKRPFEATLQVSEVTPKVTADVFTLARMSKDSLRLSTAINYKIRDAGVFRLLVRLGEGLKLLDLNGRDINTQQVKDNVLAVDLRSKAEGEYRLVLETEKAVRDASDLQVPAIEVLDVEREWGYLAVTTVPGVKVESKGFEGIRQINVRELAWSLYDAAIGQVAEGQANVQQQSNVQVNVQRTAGGAGEPVELAFRYLKHPYKLAVTVSDVMPEVSVESRAVYALTEKNLELSADLTYDIRKAGIFYLKAWLAPELRLLAVEGENIDDWKRDEKDGTLTVTLRSKVEGSYLLRLKAEMPVTDVAKGLAVPGFSVRDVKKERGHVALSATSDLKVKTETKATERIVEIDIQDLPPALAPRASTFAIAYKYFESPWKLALAIEKVKPRVTAETFSFVSIGEQLVTSSTTLRFTVLYAGVSQFKVKLPPGVNDPDIEGEAIKHKEKVKNADGDVWTVTLHSPRTGTYSLYFTFQREVKEKGGAVAFAGPQVLPVADAYELERETGYLAFAARPDVEMSTPKIENLTPIDDKEVPPDYKRGITVPILMAFRYLKHPYAFAVDIRQNEFAKVLVAVVEALRLSTTVTEEGHMITDVAARVRNTREQYLRMELPEDAEIWSLFVAGQQETPFQTKEGARTITLVPIARTARGDETFDVRLRFGRKLKPLGSAGMVDLACPPLNLPVLRLGWSLSMPANYELVADAGNMRRVAYFTENELNQANPDAPLQLAPQAGDQAGQQALDVQSTRNLAVINRMSEGRGGAGAMEVHQGKAAGLPSMYAGARPQTGRVYHFQTLISLDEPGKIHSRYVKTNLGWTGKGLIVLALLALAWGLWFKSGLSAATRIGWMGMGALVLLGAHTLMEESYREYLATMVLTTGGCFAAYILLHIGSAVVEWDRRRREEAAREEILPFKPAPGADAHGPTQASGGPAPSAGPTAPPAGGAPKA